jgi:hypothetical protein
MILQRQISPPDLTVATATDTSASTPVGSATRDRRDVVLSACAAGLRKDLPARRVLRGQGPGHPVHQGHRRADGPPPGHCQGACLARPTPRCSPRSAAATAGLSLDPRNGCVDDLRMLFEIAVVRLRLVVGREVAAGLSSSSTDEVLGPLSAGSGVERLPVRRVRVGPFLCDEAAVPGQKRGGRDESVATQSRGSSRASAERIGRSGQEGRGGPTWRRRTVTSSRSVITLGDQHAPAAAERRLPAHRSAT